MNGGDEDPRKEAEQGLSTLSSSYCSSSSSHSGSESAFNRDDENFDEFRPMPKGNRIPLSVFEPSFPTDEWSMISDGPYETTSFSQNFDLVYSSSTSMKSPSIQPMDRSVGYDPERIPSSIFSSKPTGTCDWSLASNESLFSIHNFSFSKDEAIFLERSEELGLIGEFSLPSTNPFVVFESKANEANNKSSSSLEPINETETEHELTNGLCNEDDGDQETKEEPSKHVEEIAPDYKMENHQNKNIPVIEEASSIRSGMISGVEGNHTGSSITRVSGVSAESGKSNTSFAFPVLVNEVRKSSSIAIPQPKNDKATTKKSETRWFSFSWFSFSCFRTWPRCCPCPPCYSPCCCL